MSTGLGLNIIKTLDRAAKDRLYGATNEEDAVSAGNEWTVKAVFGMLAPLEQQIVLRLLVCGEAGVDITLARNWVTVSGSFARAVAVLESLRIVEALDGAKKLRIPTAFSTNLGKALAGNTEEPWRLQGVTNDKKPPTLDQLDQWTRWRWTNVLLFLTGEDLDETAIPPQCAQDFLKGAQLMTPIEGGMLEITGQGVDFLLKPRAEQVWVLVDEYLKNHAPQNDRGDVVALILSLAYTTVGRSYAIAELSDPQQRALEVLFALGLIFRRKETSSRFYPTSIGAGVAFGSAEKADTGGVSILVQTNFQVVAYTDATQASSQLVLSTLGLFCEIKVRLPNVVVGAITRDIVKNCITQRQIRCGQILKFLETHAHPLTAKNASPIPPNVRDQIILWAGEDQRVAFRQGWLLECRTDDGFHAAVKAAKTVHWRSVGRRRLFVDDADRERCLIAAAESGGAMDVG